MTVAGIATIPSRLHEVQQTIQSLIFQVDKINVSLNNYTAIPDYFKQPKIEAEITHGTDEQKFRKVEGEIFLSVDDDLIYPPDYVQKCKDSLEKYEIITFHGRSFDVIPIESYYRSKSRKYRCLDKVSDDIPVQVGGTGCMAFKPENFFLSLDDFKYRYMADIQVAMAARRQNKKIICLAHEAGWIKYQPVNNTIYDKFRNDDWQQTQLVNESISQHRN